MLFLSNLKDRQHQVLILGIVWAIAQFTCLYLWGTQTELESIKYIHAAEHLLQYGSFPEKGFWFYSITVFVIAFSKWLHAGNGLVFFIQLLVSLVAHLSFFNALRSQCRENHVAPFITVLALCLILPYQRWNFTLYTESLFYSLVLLFFSGFISIKKEKGISIWKQLALLTLVIAARPMGVLFLLPWLSYHLKNRLKKRKRLKIILFISGVFVFIFICELILSNIGGYHTLEAYRQGNIICGIPGSDNSSFLVDFQSTKSSLWNLLIYIIDHPGVFFSLTLYKTISFFLLYREYYSPFHNSNLILLCGIFYLPIIFQVCTKRINHGLFIFLSIISFYLAVILQCDDYHNRFIMTLIPLFLYAGLFQLIQRFVR